MAELALSSLSRYKDTKVYTAADGTPEFALWAAPIEFTESRGGYRKHRVKKNEIGLLDMLAVRYFGPGHESLWWAIALANGMVDPEMEMFPQQVLLIPPRDAVVDFIARVPSE
jgi:hypothetical protein